MNLYVGHSIIIDDTKSYLIDSTLISKTNIEDLNATKFFFSMNNNSDKKKFYLPPIPWLLGNAVNLYGTYSMVSTALPIASFFVKNYKNMAMEFKLYGISPWQSSKLLSNTSFKLTGLDAIMIGINTGLDIYDSIQRGVSTKGIILGALLTVAADILLLYTNKAILYTTTAIGTAICPGLGTAIGFVIGVIICLVVNWKVGEWLSEKIDSIAK